MEVDVMGKSSIVSHKRLRVRFCQQIKMVFYSIHQGRIQISIKSRLEIVQYFNFETNFSFLLKTISIKTYTFTRALCTHDIASHISLPFV